MNKIKMIKLLLIISIGFFLGACTINKKLPANVRESLTTSDHYSEGEFHNSSGKIDPSLGKTFKVLKRFVFERRIDKRPRKPLPIKTVTRAQLDGLSDDDMHLVKLGHSSILLKVYGKYWLIDPVFSTRVFPVSFVGPKRFQPPPIKLRDLPPIDTVLISHDHYDHLDELVVKALLKQKTQFFVPLGVERHLKAWGVKQANIKSFDWWQEHQNEQALFVFTPAQHGSGRYLNDFNRTLWGSWVIKTDKHSIYFSGDTGYFPGYKKIGDKYGPFDLTLIETGAYDDDWPGIHMKPEQSVQAHIDLRGKTMLPIHNSAFDLALHPWYEPLERVNVAAQKRNVSLTTPIVGEVFTATQKVVVNSWWKNRVPK